MTELFAQSVRRSEDGRQNLTSVLFPMPLVKLSRSGK